MSAKKKRYLEKGKSSATSVVSADNVANVKQTCQFRQISTDLIMESISYGIFSVDLDWRITSFNRTAEKITGISRLNAIGRPCSSIFLSNMCGKDCAVQQTLSTKSAVLNRTALITDSQGRQIPISISTSLLRNCNNKIIGSAQIFRDISQSAFPPGIESRQIHLTELVSRNKIMGKIIKILPQIAASESTVLIEGENGTGKEALAHLIHTFSCRNNKPFVSIDCGALPPHLLATELYGNEDEFLTCSSKARPSCFDRAEGSTLFLDEINKISLPVQERLLRILQKKTCEPRGSTNSMHTDIRVITSSSDQLSSLVKEGAFLQNLYYQVNIIQLHLPSLRDRKEDLPLLIDHFVFRWNRMKGKTVKGISHETMDLLMNYDFPGNISELNKVIEHAFALCDEDYIQTSHLPEKIKQEARIKSDPVGIETAVQAVEAQAIIAALKRNNFNRKAAALDLGIHKSTFFRKIKHLGIVLPQVDGRFRQPVNGNNK